MTASVPDYRYARYQGAAQLRLDSRRVTVFNVDQQMIWWLPQLVMLLEPHRLVPAVISRMVVLVPPQSVLGAD